MRTSRVFAVVINHYFMVAHAHTAYTRTDGDCITETNEKPQ